MLDILLRERLLRLAPGRDMPALSAPGAFERLVDQAGHESNPRRGTVVLVGGDETVTLTVRDAPDTTLPPLPERGGPTLPRFGRHVRNDYDDSAGGIPLDRLAGCRIEYNCFDGGGHLLVLNPDADGPVPNVQAPD